MLSGDSRNVGEQIVVVQRGESLGWWADTLADERLDEVAADIRRLGPSRIISGCLAAGVIGIGLGYRTAFAWLLSFLVAEGLAALATSGDYQQFFIFEGRRFHHMLDPHTGYPARAAVSATAWAGTAMDADILSTAVFVLGAERGIDWIESLPDAEALVFFERDGELDYRASSGVAQNLRFMEKADNNSSF